MEFIDASSEYLEVRLTQAVLEELDFDMRYLQNLLETANLNDIVLEEMLNGKEVKTQYNRLFSFKKYLFFIFHSLNLVFKYFYS